MKNEAENRGFGLFTKNLTSSEYVNSCIRSDSCPVINNKTVMCLALLKSLIKWLQ